MDTAALAACVEKCLRCIISGQAIVATAVAGVDFEEWRIAYFIDDTHFEYPIPSNIRQEFASALIAYWERRGAVHLAAELRADLEKQGIPLSLGAIWTADRGWACRVCGCRTANLHYRGDINTGCDQCAPRSIDLLGRGICWQGDYHEAQAITMDLGMSVSWEPILSPPVAAACERARLFLADLTDLSVADARKASELRHRLRRPGADVLRQAVLFLGGLYPAQPGQAELVRELHRLFAGPERNPRDLMRRHEENVQRLDRTLER